MTLLDIATRLATLDDHATIFAERVAGEFSPGSRAVVLALSEAEQEQPVADVAARHCPGLEYCLEISIAKVAVRVWSRWRQNQVPSSVEAAEAICHKATYDTWGPLVE